MAGWGSRGHSQSLESIAEISELLDLLYHPSLETVDLGCLAGMTCPTRKTLSMRKENDEICRSSVTSLRMMVGQYEWSLFLVLGGVRRVPKLPLKLTIKFGQLAAFSTVQAAVPLERIWSSDLPSVRLSLHMQ